MLMRLDVGVVGFVLFTLIGPMLGGYVAAWLIGGLAGTSSGDAFAGLFAGGTDTLGVAAAIGAGAGLGLTLRIAAGPILDAFVGAWPDDEPLATDPRRHILSFGRAQRATDIEEEDPVGLGSAVGWVGTLLGTLLVLGLTLAAWPSADMAAVERVRAGTGGALDWLAAAFPAIVRIIVSAIGGIMAGAIWSTMTSPVADAEP
jgi:hypothetical protein